MSKRKYKYTGNSSFESAYNDCKLVDESIVDDQSFQDSDTGLVLYYMDRILEALEKQIPKKPDYIADGYADGLLCYDYAKCPICGHDFEYGINDWESDYCSDCGQRLDWEAVK